MNSNSVNNANTSATTPSRFTKEEKSVLYQLFQENEDVIDIKHRRNSAKKNFSVRECWDKIASQYNDNPNITTNRNVKQIQKFWLNARLRKHYPSKGETNSIVQIKPLKKFETIELVEENIKFEKECEPEEIEMIAEEDENLQQEIEISTSSNDELLDENSTHQYDIDHISAEKLTLNDLLEFKNSRSRNDEIVLQIKTPDLINTVQQQQQQQQQHHQKDNNNLPSTQTYTTTSYRITNSGATASIVNEQQYQTPIIQHPQQILTTPIQHLHQKAIPITTTQYCPHMIQSPRSPAIDNFEDKINFYRLKEATLKHKEEQLKLEKIKIELAHAKEDLKHSKELHQLQIEEIKLKLKLLSSNEKKLKNGNVVKKQLANNKV